MIRVFISYRRSDGEHAAQRVRGAMRQRFGDDAVFIDRDIPAGVDWAAHLEARIAEATEVIVLVGDAFVTELRRRSSAGSEAPAKDWLRIEIETALKLGKKIYPVIIGRREMPDRSRLPAGIEALADTQALFAREPAFDAAMGKLADTIAASRGWVPEPPAAPALSATRTLLALALAFLALAAASGGLVHWLATGRAVERLEAALWLGLHFVLLTLLWALGPYVVYRGVAEVRTRALLPVHNALGALTMLNMSVALLAGGTFLLLSTRADWSLELRWVMPVQPGPLAYGLQGGVLVAIVFAAVAVAMLEPAVRRRGDELSRRIGMQGLMLASCMALAVNLWFAESVAASIGYRPAAEQVPLIGYFLLTPALPAMLVALQLARALLGLDMRAWYNRALLGMALCIHAMASLGYYAHGPAHFMGGLQP